MLNKEICILCWTENGRQPDGWPETAERHWQNNGLVLCMACIEAGFPVDKCYVPVNTLVPPEHCYHAAEHVVSQEPDGCR